MFRWVFHNKFMIRLIDWLMFYPVLAIFLPYNGGFIIRSFACWWIHFSHSVNLVSDILWSKAMMIITCIMLLPGQIFQTPLSWILFLANRPDSRDPESLMNNAEYELLMPFNYKVTIFHNIPVTLSLTKMTFYAKYRLLPWLLFITALSPL